MTDSSNIGHQFLRILLRFTLTKISKIPLKTMKVAVLALCLVCVAAKPNHYDYGYAASPKMADSYAYAARPEVKIETLKTPPVPILKHEMHDDNYGTYNLEFKTGDGTSQVESGKLMDFGTKEGPTVVKEGSYSFTSPEGQTFTVNWKSDEKGFQAWGDHLPTPPPMPEEIRKGLLVPRIPEFQTENMAYNKAGAYGYYH